MAGQLKPKHAATVILLRPEQRDGFEVFMTRRPMGMNFLGGAYVFPGGGIGDQDAAEALLKRCCGLSRQDSKRILHADLSPELCLAHWVAAIRELFEEVGVLLCVTEAGKPINTQQQGLPERLTGKRRELIEGRINFLTLLESEGLFCDAAGLSYFSHWRTPEEFSTRFDTRFYLTPLPPDQDPLPISEEVAHSIWLTPERALKLCQEGSLPVIFPTFSSLRTLADFDSLDSLLAEYRKDRR